MEINYTTARMIYQILDAVIDIKTTVKRNIEEWEIPTTFGKKIELVFKLMDTNADGWTTTDCHVAGYVSSWLLNIAVAMKDDLFIIARRMFGMLRLAESNGEISKKKYIALRARYSDFYKIIEWIDGLYLWTFHPLSCWTANKTLLIAF